MKEKPILFSGPMVRAILEGRKTQTRRAVSSLPEGVLCVSALPESDYKWRFTDFDRTVIDLRCPYGRPPIPLEPADRLWVREAWRSKCGEQHPDCVIYNATDDDKERHVNNGGGRFKPSIHMFRWASRITLEITGVRVERLQDITPGDCEAEGVGGFYPHLPACSHPPVTEVAQDCHCPGSTLPEIFHAGWDWLNKGRGYGWDVNPWVWIIEFRRLDGIQQS